MRTLRRHPSICACAVGTLLALARPARAESDPHASDPNARPSADVEDLRAMRLRFPGALEALLAGERALARGDARAAEPLLAQAVRLAPSRSLVARRHCQALLALGRRTEALKACRSAVELQRIPAAEAALAVALASGTPSTDDLAIAFQLTDDAARRAPEHPWAYAAECEMAVRLGRPAMLKACVQELQKIAPGHYATLRYERLAAEPKPPWWLLASFVTLIFAALGTLRHALLRRPSLPKAVATATLLLAVFLAPSRARAQESSPSGDPAASERVDLSTPGSLSEFSVDRTDPKKSLPTPEQRDGNPIQYGYHLMDLGDLADAAIAKKDFAQAAKYYDALAYALPTIAVVFRKACDYHEKANQLEQATAYCAHALTKEGATLGDFTRYADLLVGRRATLTKEQINSLRLVIDHLKKEKAEPATIARLQCELAVRIQDVPTLTLCTAALKSRAPAEGRTLSFEWALAMHTGEFDKARQIIEKARKSDLTPASLKTMEAATRAESAWWRPLQRHWRAVVATLLGAGVLALGALLVLRRRARVQPTQASA
jgi:tetratricopeptide (TPR) repeat protein